MPEVELFKSTSAELFSTALAPLRCGNKELELSIDFVENIATTKIATIENAELVAGATTEVYKEALKIMEAVATKLNRPILYLFSTDNLKLQA